VGVGNLRGFCLWGVEPSNASLVCWKTAMGPENCKDMADGDFQPGKFMGSSPCNGDVTFKILQTS